MKKLLLASAALISLAACQNDDDDTDSPASIVGTWKLSKMMVYSGKDNKVLDEDAASACESKSTFVFANDGKVTTHSYFHANDGSCEDLGTTTTPYSYNASTKILTINGEETPLKSMTANTFEVITETWDYNGDNIDDNLTSVFTRVK